MSFASDQQAKVRNDALRARHVGKWGFKRYTLVTRPWCGRCGAPDHHGVVLSKKVDALRAVVRVAMECCSEPIDLNAMFFVRTAKPYPDSLLALRRKVKP